jgi:hypothetical protein
MRNFRTKACPYEKKKVYCDDIETLRAIFLSTFHTQPKQKKLRYKRPGKKQNHDEYQPHATGSTNTSRNVAYGIWNTSHSGQYTAYPTRMILWEQNSIFYYYSKTCLKLNLKGPEHFSAKARFPFNQGTLHIKIKPRHARIWDKIKHHTR